MIGLNTVTVLARAALLAVVETYEQRGDFADLLHPALAAEAGATAFVTFDRAFAKPADTPLAIETL